MENLLYIEWNDKYNVGIAIIDEQHRGIVSAINSLHYFISEGHGEEALRPTLIFLEQYINIHFITEERLIAEADYPDIKEHILMHEDLSRKTKKVSADLTKNQDMNSVLVFLREWWLTHINKEDRKYVPYVLKVFQK